MRNIKEILIERDGMSMLEADELILEAQEELYARINKEAPGDPHEICSEYFNLEPDYLMELI